MFTGLLKVLRIWREAVSLNKSRPRIKREKNEIEFLPVAVELLESPASPAGHTIAFLIIGLFVVSVLWATFGRIDLVVVSQGRIIPGACENCTVF